MLLDYGTSMLPGYGTSMLMGFGTSMLPDYGTSMLPGYGSPLAHTCHLDKVQREAALVCTGAYKHTRNINLMEELGWDSLSVRRKNQKLCLMYKIQNDIAPSYLSDSCPPP
jgi:hypothetical protein